MTSVWAFSRFKQNRHYSLKVVEWKAGNGWDYCWDIKSLEDLNTLLVKNKLFGMVSRLAINVHGQAGYLDFKVPVGIEINLGRLQAAFLSMAHYLRADAHIIFFSCNVGSGERGDKFLTLLSKLLPQKTIVGFTKESHAYGGVGTYTPAGMMYVKADWPNDGVEDLSEYHDVAKWAKNGNIVRPPKLEVILLQGIQGKKSNKMQNIMMLCGSKLCTGHDKKGQGHWCSNYERSTNFQDMWEKNRGVLDDAWQLYEKVYGKEVPAVKKGYQTKK